jgi:hypothetical protein
MNAVPRFLWNAKMRFGKTFTAYQRKKLGAKRLLVVTFKPAIRGCLADRSRDPTWISTGGSTSPAPLTAIRPRSTVGNQLFASGSFQDLLRTTMQQETSNLKTSGSTR